MSEDDVEADVDEDAEEEGADGPALEDDDLVEIDPDVAAEVAAETSDEEVTDDDVDDAGDQEASSDDSLTGETTSPGSSRTSIGHVYCQALGMGATLARERQGSGLDPADREQHVDDYADMARQLDIDDYVDEWVAEHGVDELTPGQAIVISTCMFGSMVLIDDPALAENLAGEVGV